MPDLVKDHGKFGEWFEPFLNKAEPDTTCRIYEVHKGELPGAADECDAWLITGSEVSTYDNAPWQKDLGEFVVNAALTTPVIGICFGHQLLHVLYGGTVEKSPKGWAIGVQDYGVFEQRSWMQPLAKSFALLMSHQDQVVKPAPDARVLGGSDFCPIGMSEIGTNILTLQPHPELELTLAAKIFRMRHEEQGPDVTDRGLATMTRLIDDGMIANWILAFVQERLPV